MDDFKTVERLLRAASEMAKVESSLRKQKEERGELFNIFNTLGISTVEAVHSRIIAALLDPFGFHGCSDLFIKSSPFFPSNIGQSASITVETEKSIGPVAPDYSSGGRMDIFVQIKTENDKYAICIENKIYAEDQRRQLFRYRDYLEREFPNKWSLFYLTLDGRENTKPEGVNYSRVSYQKDICEWILKCISIAAEKPLVRETLVQYLNTIKEITNNEWSMKMSKRLIDVIKESDGYIEALAILEPIIPQLKESIIDDFLLYLNNKYQTSFSFKTSTDYSMFYFEKPEWVNLSIRIAFMFEKRNYQDLFYGITKKEEKTVIPEALKKLCQENEFETTDWWAGRSWMENPFKNWDLATFSLINKDKEKLASSVKEKTEKLVAIIDEYLSGQKV